MFWPCETRTSTCRNFATISSGLYRFLAIAVLLDVKDIPQVGPLQWGWITFRFEQLLAPHRYRSRSPSTATSLHSQQPVRPSPKQRQYRIFLDLDHGDLDETVCIGWTRNRSPPEHHWRGVSAILR